MNKTTAQNPGTPKTYETSDLAIAAYLMLKGLQLLSAGKLPSGKFQFIFADPDTKARQFAVQFLSSECCKFDTHVKNLKKLLY